MCFFLLPIVYACVCVYGVLCVVYARVCAGVYTLWVCGESGKDVGCPALIYSLTPLGKSLSWNIDLGSKSSNPLTPPSTYYYWGNKHAHDLA